METYKSKRVKIIRATSCLYLEEQINDFISGKDIYDMQITPLQTTNIKGLTKYDYLAVITYYVLDELQ